MLRYARETARRSSPAAQNGQGMAASQGRLAGAAQRMTLHRAGKARDAGIAARSSARPAHGGALSMLL
jgi:hypothetical protein